MGDRLHTHWIDRGPTLAADPFCDIFCCLCHHPDRKCGHDCLNQNQSSTPHTNVLFPYQLIFPGYLLFNNSDTKLLSDILKEKSISFASCFTQLYFYAIFGTTECYLLAVMAYDRYVAICNPILYFITMSQRKCVHLIAISYIAGIINASVHTIAACRLSFCGPNIVKNFYCEIPPLLAVSCSDVSLNDLLLFVFVGLNITVTCLIVLTSYMYIPVTILRIRSAKSRRKAFSTCTSNLMVITIFYGCSSFMYARPSSRQNYHLDQMASVFYVVMIPMLNPFIYSMRNQEVRDAFRNILGRLPGWHGLVMAASSEQPVLSKC